MSEPKVVPPKNRPAVAPAPRTEAESRWERGLRVWEQHVAALPGGARSWVEPRSADEAQRRPAHAREVIHSIEVQIQERRPRETVDWRTWAVFTEWHGRALGLSKRMRLELARLKAWRHLHRDSPEWGRLGRPPTPPDVVYWRSRAKEALWVLQRVREHLDDRGDGGLPEELVARVREVCRPPGETEQQEQEG